MRSSRVVLVLTILMFIVCPLAFRQRSYLPLDLWEILLRIIGLGRVAVKKSAEDFRESTPSAMIV